MRAVLWVVVLLAATIGAEPSAQGGKQEVVGSVPRGPKDERLTPDYKAGPWFEMGADFPFKAFTDRPRLQEAMKLLREVSNTISEARAQAVNTRNAKKPEEDKLIADGQDVVKRLAAEVEAIKQKTAAHNSIAPLQTEIHRVIRQELAPSLRLASHLHQIDADVRLPFAERLAVYTQDLQKVLRAKEDAQCSMQEYMTAAELADALRKYDAIAAEIQAKVQSEISTSGQVLTPNTARLQDALSKVAAAEDSLSVLRAKLEQAIKDGMGFIGDEQSVKERTLHNERALVSSIQTAGAAQDSVVEHVQEIENEQLVLAHHVASVLSGLMTDAEEPEDAKQVPRAQLQVANDDDDAAAQ